MKSVSKVILVFAVICLLFFGVFYAIHGTSTEVCMPTWDKFIGKLSEFDSLRMVRQLESTMTETKDKLSVSWAGFTFDGSDFFKFFDSLGRFFNVLGSTIVDGFSLVGMGIFMVMNYIGVPFEFISKFFTMDDLFSCPVPAP